MSEEKRIDKLLKQYEKDGSLPIFRTTKNISNMRVDRFIVPEAAVAVILRTFDLPTELQEAAVNKLVDRTPDWLELEESQQLDEIKAALLLESVAWFLRFKNFIQESCTMYENGFDLDGNVVLDAMYVKETHTQKEIQRLQEEKLNEKAKKKKASIIPFPKGAPSTDD